MEKFDLAENSFANVYLIGSNGEKLGVFTAEDAVDFANEKELDLIKVGYKEGMFFCKLLDEKKQDYKKNKVKKTNKVKLKEIRFTVNTAVHDIMTKIKHINEYIGDGDKVKISVKMGNRIHYSTAKAKLDEVLGLIDVPFSVESSGSGGFVYSIITKK